VFGAERSTVEPTVDAIVLHARIGELTLENDFLAGALGKAGLLPSASDGGPWLRAGAGRPGTAALHQPGQHL
jgi:hypothetical protein